MPSRLPPPYTVEDARLLDLLRDVRQVVERTRVVGQQQRTLVGIDAQIDGLAARAEQAGESVAWLGARVVFNPGPPSNDRRDAVGHSGTVEEINTYLNPERPIHVVVDGDSDALFACRSSELARA